MITRAIRLVVTTLTLTLGRDAVAQRPSAATSAMRVYRESEVRKPARPVPGTPGPNHPTIFQRSELRLEGRVRAEFVVDTTGVPDTLTFRVLETPHKIFSTAVKTALPGMRFSPAERDGHKVRQLVEMPFDFKAP